MEFASCFIGHSIDQFAWSPDYSKCKKRGINIIGIAKLLAYGDFLKAQASQRNETVFAVLDEEINKYPYVKKYEPKVGERKSLQFCLLKNIQ